VTSFLDTIRSQIGLGFSGRLRDGTLRRFSNAASAGLDAKGDPNAPGSTDFTFEGFRDEFSAYAKATAGIPETDSKIVIIAASLATDPQDQDFLFIEGLWWRVRRVSTDPATAAWACQSYVVTEPV